MCKAFGNQTDYAVFYLGQEWMEEIWIIGVGQFGYLHHYPEKAKTEHV